MSVQRYVRREGRVRYRARVKHHGREVATRVFDRKRDAEAWEEDQKRRLRGGLVRSAPGPGSALGGRG